MVIMNYRVIISYNIKFHAMALVAGLAVHCRRVLNALTCNHILIQ